VGVKVPAELLLLAVLVILAATAGAVGPDWWRRLGARRFDAIYERNLLRRTGRGWATSRRPRTGA
jgi:hypothetical protein